MNDHNLMRCNKCDYHWFMGLLWYGGRVGQICSKCGSKNIQLILAVRDDRLTIVNKKWKQNYKSSYPDFKNINEDLVND